MAEILSGTELKPRQREYVETIENSGVALLTIINDILDYSKIEAGKMSLEDTPFDLRSTIDDVAALLGGKAREKGIELVTRFAPGVPERVRGDAARLRQVITNLCGNAIKFTDVGHVLIDVEAIVDDRKADLRITVSDTGIGIEQEKLERVFEQFTQAESSTTRRYGGTGLGLTISRRIAQAMGGSIRAYSRVGKGSDFVVKVPFALVECASADDIKPVDLAGLRILAVDDLEVNRKIFAEQLGQWGADYTTVFSGEKAILAMRDAVRDGVRFDAVLLDFNMPGMDGLAVARQVLADPLLKQTPIVVLSSSDTADVVDGFQRIGVTNFLTKPVRNTALYEAICRSVADRNISALKQTTSAHGVDAAGGSEGPGTPNNNDTEQSVARLLVAEDNQVNRMVIESMLKPAGYDLVFAENGEIAVDAFKEGSFDAVLMDVSMPVMDGREATRLIRAYEAATEAVPTPIIALTAHAMAGDRESLLVDGMSHYLSKPVRKAVLLETLAALDDLPSRASA